ncbi:MAG TPA: amphi-Trp domain-containing protein [Herpetosiphonaceae bacterium]
MSDQPEEQPQAGETAPASSESEEAIAAANDEAGAGSAEDKEDEAQSSAKRGTKPGRDIEKVYSVGDFVAKLRRLADALEKGQPFAIQVAGERLTVPASASISIEHERGDDGEEELEFQLRWQR